jgi:putative effector of murein hydrolase
LQLVKVGLVVVGGFYFSLLSTAWSVVAVRKFVSKRSKEIVEIEDTATTTTTTTASPFSASFKEFQETTMTASPLSASFKEFEESLPPPTPQPSSFSKELHDRLRTMSVVTGTATVLTSQFVPRLEPYCSCAFFLWTTLYTFVVGARLPKKVTKLLHPLVTCTALTWAASYGLAIITSRPWKTILSSYRRRGSGSAVNALFHHRGIGAGDILLFLLGPAVVSLACQMYERRQLVKSNVAAVATGVTVGSAGGLFGTAAAVRLLQIGNPYLRLSLLSRNITSPLAMAMAAMLGANVSLAVALVVVTGLLGANFGPAILDAHGIDDEIARGMAMGAASHGLGTAALVNEKLAFPFAAISMALTASVGTVLVSIPLVQRMILQLTLGW